MSTRPRRLANPLLRRGTPATNASLVPDLALFDVAAAGARTGPVKFGDRPYQVEAVTAMVAGLAHGGRGQLRTACGTGKTYMSMWTAQRLPVHTGIVVIVAPTVGLVNQILQSWAAQDDRHTAIAVCGDETVLPDSPDTVADIVEPVTTDPDVIAHWLRTTPAEAGTRLIVGTHISSHLIGEGLQKARTAADLLVIDEAHHTAGMADKHSALVHEDEVLPATRRLYCTATPRILSPAQRVARAYRGELDFVHSMDDEKIFGPVLYHYSVSQAIADGYLDDYQLAVIGVTRADVLALLQRAQAAGTEQPELHTAMVQTAIARAAESYGLRRIVTFCTRVADAATFARTFPATLELLPDVRHATGPLHAAHVHGRMTAGERDNILETLRQPPLGGWAVVSNVGCLLEGVDVPSLDGVAFAAPKSSTVDIVQAVGRALRPNPYGSGKAIILVPILLPEDNTAQLDPGTYDQLWEVVRALRAHDDVLAAALDGSRAHGTRNTNLSPRITFDLPEGYDHDGEFLRHLTVHLVHSATSPWWDGYAQVADYHAAHGTIDLPQAFVHDGFAIGAFLENARQQHRAGRLMADAVAALDKLGMIWEPQARKKQAAIAAVRRFHATFGHLLPDYDYVDDTGFPLHAWLGGRRYRHSRGKLSDEWFEILDELGMVWDLSAHAWNEGLSAAMTFHARYGHLNVPPTYKPLDRRGRPFNLRGFLHKRRSEHRAGTLAPRRVAALEALDIDWNPKDTVWRDILAAITTYFEEHGDLNFAHYDYYVNGINIGQALYYARKDYAKGELPASRIAELEALGIDWTPGRWGRVMETLRGYYAKHGNIDVPKDFRAHDCSLREWIAKQRRDRAAGNLSDAQIAALDAVGMEWEHHTFVDENWAEQFARARKFRAKHGHLNPGTSNSVDDDERRVYTWLGGQRRLYAAGDLAPKRIAALESIGIEWTVPPRAETRWQAKFDELVAFHAKHGHLSVPADEQHDQLNRWLRHQRAQHAKRQLRADRVTKLSGLGMDWRVLPPHDRTWENRFVEAKTYHTKCGPLADLPPGYTTSTGLKLDSWIRRCQRLALDGELSPERVQRLADLGVVITQPPASYRHRADGRAAP